MVAIHHQRQQALAQARAVKKGLTHVTKNGHRIARERKEKIRYIVRKDVVSQRHPLL